MLTTKSVSAIFKEPINKLQAKGRAGFRLGPYRRPAERGVSWRLWAEPCALQVSSGGWLSVVWFRRLTTPDGWPDPTPGPMSVDAAPFRFIINTKGCSFPFYNKHETLVCANKPRTGCRKQPRPRPPRGPVTPVRDLKIYLAILRYLKTN